MPKPYLCDRRRLAVPALLALAVLQAAVPALARVCERPTFTSTGGPLPLGTGTDIEPRVLAAGSFFRRDDPASCSCDLAVALRVGNDVRLVFLRGKDDGSFQPPDDSAALDLQGPPIAMTTFGPVASGRLDALAVLTGTTTSASLTVYVPQADGTYVQHGSSRSVSASPSALATGDFNGDDKADLAVASQKRPQLTVLLGDGNGGFLSEAIGVDLSGVAQADGGPESLAAGRFFGTDGDDEIAVGVSDVAGNVSVAFVGRTASGRLEIIGQQRIGRGHDILVATQRRAGPPDLVVAAFTVDNLLQAGMVKAIVPGAPSTIVDVAVALDRPPRSLASRDFNSDGIADLIVSTYGQGAADGRIRILKGRATEPQFDPLFETRASVFRPKGIVIGEFGRNAITGTRHPGIAALDDRNDSAFVLRGNGAGAFVQPTGVRSDIARADAAMFVVGDFHRPEGDSPLSDLGYVSRNPDRGDFELLIMLAEGNRGFRPSAAPPLPIGRQPMLITAGRFDGDRANDIAVVDANLGDTQRRPLLKIFRGTGNGRFTVPNGVSEFVLHPGDVPVGIAAGQFRGTDPAKPLDIAVVSQTTSGGRLTRFFNNGSGVFQREEPSIALRFKPGGILVSNKFRPGGRYDVAIKHDRDNSFLFLSNAGDGQFVTEETFPDQDGGSPDFTRNDLFFAADVNSDGRDDIVGFDGDRSLDIFTGNPPGIFRFASDAAFAVPNQEPIEFDVKDAQFFLRDFGDGTPGLAGLVRTRGQPAIVTLKGDGAGKFVKPVIELLELPVGARNSRTEVSTNDISHPEIILAEPITSAFAGQFANIQQGNDLPDLGFIASVRSTEVSAGKCDGDMQSIPAELEVCHEKPATNDGSFEGECREPCGPAHNHCIGQCVPRICTNPPCRPPFGSCVVACPRPEPIVVCEMRPASAFCRTTSAPLPAYLIVVGNSCND